MGSTVILTPLDYVPTNAFICTVLHTRRIFVRVQIKVYPLRTPFTMIVYFDQSRVDSCLNAKPITVFEPANCNTRRLGIETIYIFSVGIGGI